jgi:hypothetical protein
MPGLARTKPLGVTRSCGFFAHAVAAKASCGKTMTRTRRQIISDQFIEQWQRSRDWLIPLMQQGHPKFMTKEELQSIAMRDLKVSKSAFNMGWMMAIDVTGRHDWLEPLRKQPRKI